MEKSFFSNVIGKRGFLDKLEMTKQSLRHFD